MAEAVKRYAQEYDMKRAGPGWDAEQAAVERMVVTGPVLDCPIGTGRYAPIYRAKGLQFEGIDLSPEMIAVAREKFPDIDARVGSVFDLPYADQSFEAAVCSRLAWWLSPEDLIRAMAELRRVARSVVLSIRIGRPGIPRRRHTFTHSQAQLDAALGGWRIVGRAVIFSNRTGCYQFVKVAP